MQMWLGESFLTLIPLLSLFGGILLFRTGNSRLKVANHAAWLSGSLSVLTAISIALTLALPTISSHRWIATAPVNLILLFLVLFIAMILIKFSRNYMAGDTRIDSYYRWFFLLIAAVSLTVISNHLIVFWCGWVSISVALHQLILHYPDRPRARLAAHKKLVLARISEALVFLAFLLLYQEHQTLLISDLANIFLVGATAQIPLSPYAEISAVSLALAALIKCAQFPVHGWLIQVVEAPTPISALLHAGIINLGGFLLILFAPLFMQSSLAQWMVLIVAGLGAVLAALVMTTRVSIKVRLAWSTSAQMGLMLVECALGLFELALLHLCAHSLYKVYAFLSSGDDVFRGLSQRLGFGRPSRTVDWVLSVAGASTLTLFAYQILGHAGPFSPWLLSGFALILLFINRPARSTGSSPIFFAILGAILLGTYGLQKIGLSETVSALREFRQNALSPADIWIMFLATSLFAGHLCLSYRPAWPIVKRLSISLFAAFYMDEYLTRISLKLWPIALNSETSQKKIFLALPQRSLEGPYS